MTNCLSKSEPLTPGELGAKRRSQRRTSALRLVIGLALASGMAAAQPAGANPDKEALKMAKSAILKEYVRRKYDRAKDQMQEAVKYCKKKQCSDQTKARLYRDLGVVFAGGFKDKKRGLVAFEMALKLNPKITLDKRVATWKLRQLFKEAKQAEPAEPFPPPKEEPAAPPEVEHEPIGEAPVGFPVPIYAEIPEDAAGAELGLSFRPQGEDSWQSLPLESVGDGYGAEIPCDWVGAKDKLEYYLYAVVGENEIPVSGSPGEPHVITLTTQPVEPALSFPLKDPPDACKGAAAAAAPKEAEAAAEPAEAPDGEIKTLWVQLVVQQDWTIVGRQDVCSIEGQNDSFYCMRRRDGVQYIGIPIPGYNDQIQTGIRWSTTRALLGARVGLGPASVGATVGLAFRGSGWTPAGASPFLPLHLEARGSFWFLGDAFAPQFGIYALAAFGVAQMDIDARTWLREDPDSAYGEWWERPQPDNNPDVDQEMDVVHRAGRHFVALGAGAFLPLVGHLALVLELRGGYLFPATAPALSAGLGAAYGF